MRFSGDKIVDVTRFLTADFQWKFTCKQIAGSYTREEGWTLGQMLGEKNIT